MAAHRLPLSFEAIWVRILRSVEGRHRLTHGNLNEEWTALTQVQKTLKETVPDIWADQLAKVVIRRQNLLREELLEL